MYYPQINTKVIRGIILRTLIITFSLLNSGLLRGQQESQFSQYTFNTIAFNPAYAGSRELISIVALQRSQWLGVDGAPSTQNISIHAPVWRRVALGFSAINDAIGNGTVQQTELKASIAYTIPLSETGRLSFGMNVGGSLNSVNFNALRISNATNNAGLNSPDGVFSPNIGAGIYYRKPSFYVGVSNPNLLNNTLYTFDPNGINIQETNTWYAITGYVHKFSDDFLLKPAALAQLSPGAPVQLDLSGTILLQEKLLFGVSYRLDAAVSLLGGYYFSNQLFGGLAFDQEITDFTGQQFAGQSLEFLLRYEFKNRKCKCSPKPRLY